LEEIKGYESIQEERIEWGWKMSKVTNVTEVCGKYEDLNVKL
jgi:hypothetical protein